MEERRKVEWMVEAGSKNEVGERGREGRERSVKGVSKLNLND